MPKWVCVALICPWGSLWPARVMSDHHQAISRTYGLPWGSTTCRNTCGDSSNGVWSHLFLWIYGTIWTWRYCRRTDSMTRDVLPEMYIWRTFWASEHVCADCEDLCPCQQWFKCSLNSSASWRKVNKPSIWHPSEFDWCWFMKTTLCVFFSFFFFGKAPTCCNSNSKTVCLSYWIAILNQQDLCQRSDNHSANTSLSKTVVSQSNANARLESEPDAALPLLPPFFLSPFMLSFVLYTSPAVLKGWDGTVGVRSLLSPHTRTQ